jgi:hypothetical protein
MARRARHAGAAAAVRVAAVPRAQALSRLDSGVLGISGGQGRAADDNAQRSAPEYLKLSLSTRVEARGADAPTGEAGLFWSTVTQSQHIRRNSVSVIVFNCCSRLGMGVQNDHRSRQLGDRLRGRAALPPVSMPCSSRPVLVFKRILPGSCGSAGNAGAPPHSVAKRASFSTARWLLPTHYPVKNPRLTILRAFAGRPGRRLVATWSRLSG